jgi:3'-phosphoadenosine 5'-phosphosulfate sulfotransferase (PAPS reductase)/FAD synthetase
MNMSVKKRNEKKSYRGAYTKVELEELDKVIPYEKNPKKHPPEQVDKIIDSIKTSGFDQPIVVDKDNVIIKGHGRRMASQKMGLKRVPVIRRDDLSAAEARASRISDNQTAVSYWDMGNLMYELEELYSLSGENGLKSTGYEEHEIKAILPGLLETEKDYQVQNIEGVIPLDLTMTAPDGLVGKRDRDESDLVTWVNDHDAVIVLFNGNRTDLAALCWAVENVPKDKLRVIDFSFGQRMWRWHDEYLDYVEQTLEAPGLIERLPRDSMEEFKDGIVHKGYPTENKRWCCNIYKRRAIDIVKKEERNCVLIVGACKEDGVQFYRDKGSFTDTGIDYAAPFATGVDEDLTAQINKAGVQLNPLYKVMDQYLCPGCSAYKSPDFVFLKKHDLDLWIRWMVTFGKAQHNKEYINDGTFNEQILTMIGDGIDPRSHGAYEKDAQELPECSQPIRNTIRFGDGYGFDPEADAKLSETGRLDTPREVWFEHEDYSKAYSALVKECEEVSESVKEKGMEKHLEESVARAKRVAEQAAEVDNG